MNFLKNILSTFIALIIFGAVAVFIFIVAIGNITDEPPVVVKENSILHLELDKPISEIEFDNPLESFQMFPGPPSTIGLVQLKEAIKEAKNDANIKGIYVNVSYVLSGISSLQEIREALTDFKKSGKFIVAYSEFYTEGAYYLASVADEIYLHPEGEIEFNGLSANVTFFKGMLDKLEIEPQIFRVGEFKSAVEPFIRKSLSDENKLQLNSILASIYSNMLDSIGATRKMDRAKIEEVSNGMLVRSPQDAFEVGLVDDLMYYDQVDDILREKSGTAKDNDLTLLSYGEYNKSYSNYKRADNEIAIIVAAGEIISGEGDMNTIGSEKFAKEIREARKNEKIKAIVLRINSPGGSFLASDVLWREIKLAAEAKPVIASMSDLAASGGYYMAMACDTIVAEPTTITGSIGIYGMIFNAQGFLNNKLGITNETVNTGEYSNFLSMSRPLSQQEKNIIQTDLEHGYETFISKAAKGRNMEVEEIKAIASGRVWSGVQAIDIGLVDMLGDLNKAIIVAASKAELEEYKIKYYPKQKSFIEQLFNDFGEDSQAKLLQRELGAFYPYVESIKRLERMNGVQTRWPYEMQIN